MRNPIILSTTVVLAACAAPEALDDDTMDTTTVATTATGPAIAVLQDADGREVGRFTFTQEATGIRVEGQASGLPPGRHGFHIHETGLCSPTFGASGDHWNPSEAQHGSANPAGPHWGDLPNLEVGDDGVGTINAVTAGGRLEGDDDLLDVGGAALVVHANPDDLTTDPAGGSGDPIACGVINR